MQTFTSDLSGKEFPVSERILGKTLRHSLIEMIQNDYPNFSADNFLSINELNRAIAFKFLISFLYNQDQEPPCIS